MQERARLLGGAAQMISVPGQGTLVRAILPLSPEPAQARATQEEATL
jgi:signal transduction histidine kinase